MNGIRNGLDCDLDVFGQHQRPLYTQICLCFAVNDGRSHASIVKMLETGLERLFGVFPWAAGQVVNEGAGEGNTGMFKIRSLSKRPTLVMKDLCNDPLSPTMDKMRKADFPMNTLGESTLCPLSTRPENLDHYPVFALQATFIPGGLLLTFLTQHQAMDMTGHGRLMYLLNKACHKQHFSDRQISIGNICRRDIIPPFADSWQPNPDLFHSFIKPSLSQAARETAPTHPKPSSPQDIWANFAFSAASLESIKSLAVQTVTTGSLVSTDDALSAFIWQSITRARLPRLNSASTTILGRNVDMRRFLTISRECPGLVVTSTWHTYNVQELAEKPLGNVASQLRAAIEDPDLVCRTRAFATLLYRTKDKSTLSNAQKLDLSTDVRLSSWVKEDLYSLDFNLDLGSPEAVRRPQFFPGEGLVYLLPRKPDGEIVAAICLRQADMERLKGEVEWVTYARFIG